MNQTTKQEFESFSVPTQRNIIQLDQSRDDEFGDEVYGFRIVDDDFKKRSPFNRKISVFVFLVLGIVALLLLYQFNAKIKSYLYLNFIQTYRKLTLTQKILYASNPEEYMDINKIKQFKQLPFCFISDEDSKWSATPDRMGNYTNYMVIQTKNKGFNYYRFQQYIEKCQKNSILIFVDKMQDFNLSSLNQIYQRNQIWLTYYQKDNSMEIVSVYLRVWQLVGMNAFTDQNKKILDSFDEQVNIQHITTSLFELCLNNLQHVRNKFSSFSSFSKLALLDSSTPIVRTPYQTLYKLSQDYYVKQEFVDKPITTLKNLQPEVRNITPVKMKRALEFEEILYLPLNHSLLQLQYIYYRSRELLIQEKEQVRFCVTVLNRNNVDRNRYKKAFDTIFQQNYSNFYVVFVDDNSTDGNTELAVKYLKELNQSVKVTIVQNLEQKFATYNIINAAFNYCGADDVQMLLDGDDQFIGRYAFQVINSQYQKKKSWVVYSSYKSNFNEYGDSRNFVSMENLIKDNKRLRRYYLGPVRTWKVKLIHAIPLKYHLNPKGFWLDTIYDQAIQFPLFEMCGTVDRISYIPELLYEYNRLYSLINSYEGEAKKNRFWSYDHVLQHQPLKKVENLEEIKQNREVMEVLQKDRGVKYELIKWV